MRRPFEHTLTPTDRASISTLLLGISAFCGVATLLAIGLATLTHRLTLPTSDEKAFMILPARSRRAGGGNEKRTPPPIRIAGAGFGPLFFQSTPCLKLFSCGADNRRRAPPSERARPVAFQQRHATNS